MLALHESLARPARPQDVELRVHALAIVIVFVFGGLGVTGALWGMPGPAPMRHPVAERPRRSPPNTVGGWACGDARMPGPSTKWQ
eukprot:6515592-Alexandrium_andersonii.AAC.1